MCLVHHDDAVSAEQWISHALAEEHAIGAILDPCSRRVREILEPDCVADFVTEHAPDLLCNALCYTDGTDPSRLRDSHLPPAGRPARFEEELRDLCAVEARIRCTSAPPVSSRRWIISPPADARVVLPQPVWPTTTSTGDCSTMCSILSRCLAMGSRARWPCIPPAGPEALSAGAITFSSSAAARSSDEPVTKGKGKRVCVSRQSAGAQSVCCAFLAISTHRAAPHRASRRPPWAGCDRDALRRR